MSQQDPLANFLGDLAKKIKTTKEHKDIMEAVYASASGTKIVKEQEDPFAGFLKKVGKTISEKIPVKEIVEPKKETKPIVVEEIKQEIKTPESEEKGNEPVKTLAFKIKEAIEKAKNKALNSAIEPAKENNEEIPKQEEPEDEQIATYISELEKIKDTGTVQQKEETITSLKELKEYVDKTVKDYSRKILDLGSGGGTVAVQYANGGTMNGDLNINGHILSGGRNISDYFGSGGGGGPTNLGQIPVLSGNWNSTYTTVNTYSGTWSTGIQDLAFNEDTALLSISNGNAVSLSALSSIPINLGDIPLLSGTWTDAYTNLVTNSAAYLLSGTGVNLGDIPVLSGDWNSVYSTTNSNSAYWADIRNDVTFNENVTIQGNLTALGSSTFKNTIFTTTSALSVVNTGPGPALYVFQAAGPYDVASFYDGDGIEVLHVGNATPSSSPKGNVGINESFPAVELTVSGRISASENITVAGGNSNQWNTAYTNLVSNSAAYLLSGTEVNLGDIPTLSGNWNSNYTTTNTNSAFWNTAYTNLVSNSANYLSGVDISLLASTSGNWNSNYTTVNTNSAFWSNWSTVSANYALGTQYVKLSGDTMTGNLRVNANIGVNTAPATPLHVQGSGSGTGGRTWLRVENTNSSSAAGVQLVNSAGRFASFQYASPSYVTGEGFSIFTESDYPLIFTTNGNSQGGGSSYISFSPGGYQNERVRYLGNGNVGIGTTAPGERLTVSGNISSSRIIYASGGNSNQWNASYTTTNTNSAFWTNAYTNLVSNSAAYLLSGTDVNLGQIPTLSSTWTTAYTNLATNSAVYLGTTRQYDYVQDGLNSYSYCGYAVPGTLTSSTGWTINRLYFSSAGTLLSSGAVTGVIWNNRYSYTY